MSFLHPLVATLLLSATLLALAVRGLVVGARTVSHPCLSRIAGSGLRLRDFIDRGLQAGSWLAVLLVALACGMPIGSGSSAVLKEEGREIVLLLDTSSSMLRTDAGSAATRFALATRSLQEFVRRRPKDRFALVSFARVPEVHCPPTSDHRLIERFCEEIDPVGPRSADDGTGIGAALLMGAEVLKPSAAATRLVILVTDGENNREEILPEEGAVLLRDLGICLYAIGLGEEYRSNHASAALEQWTRITDGRCFIALDEASLEGACAEIDRLENSPLWSEVAEDEPGLPLISALAAALWSLVIAARSSFARVLP